MPLSPDASPERVALIALVFLLAGVVKGVVGLGLPTISMALLALFMPPASAAALLVAPSFVTNVWQAGPLRRLAPIAQRLFGMQLGVCAGTIVGALVLGPPSGVWASRMLGVALLAYGAWGLFGTPRRVPTAYEPWLGPIVGAVTGFVTSATGVFVVPAVPYLQSLDLSRDDFVQAMGLSFTVSTIALACALTMHGSYDVGTLGASLSMLVPALVGMAMGERLRKALSPAAFRRGFMISIAALGAYQIGSDR